MLEIPKNGYLFYKNIILLTKKSHYMLLTEFDNLELKYIQEETDVLFRIENYKEDEILYWVIRIIGTDIQINKTKEIINDILIGFDHWINSKNMHIYRIDPNIVKKIKKKFKKYNNIINIFYGKTFLLISGNNKKVSDKIINNISNYIYNFEPCMRFIWVEMPEFMKILYKIEPLCKNKYCDFKIIPSKCSIVSNNTIKTHILIRSDKIFINQIWKSVDLIIKNLYKKEDEEKKYEIEYLNLFIHDKYKEHKKFNNNIIKYREFNPQKMQIPISKQYRNDDILSSSI